MTVDADDSRPPSAPSRRGGRLVAALAARDTHGRWPWVAAGAAIPSSVAVLAARKWLRDDFRWAFWTPLPALLWHQTEEWVFPGGFLPWFNRAVMGSDEDEFPITRRLGLVINVGPGWGIGLLGALVRARAPWIGTTVLATNVGNAALHVGQAARQRAYNPGLATSLTLLAPLGGAGLVRVARSPGVGAGDLAVGMGLGIGASLATFQTMKRRMRSRRARRD